MSSNEKTKCLNLIRSAAQGAIAMQRAENYQNQWRLGVATVMQGVRIAHEAAMPIIRRTP